MKRFFTKALKWLARIAVVLVVLVILFYLEEDWRGANDWATCQKELLAKGEALDLRQLIPPGKPADDLSKIPLFAELYQKNPDYQYNHQFEWYLWAWPHPSYPAQMNDLDVYLNPADHFGKADLTSYMLGKAPDLASWQALYRSQPNSKLPSSVGTAAQDVLATLKQFDPLLEQIKTAVQNPNAYWPVDYDAPYLSDLDGNLSMYKPAMVLALRGIAHLENNETELAKKDYLLICQLNDPLHKGCFLIDYTVIAVNYFYANAILWDGLHRHAWSTTQLQEMEAALASTDMLALGIDTLRIERASTISGLDFIKSGGAPELRRAAGVGKLDKYGFYDSLQILGYRPSGEWDQDKCFYAREIQDRIEAVHIPEGTLDARGFDQGRDDNWNWSWRRQYVFVSMIQLPGVDIFGYKIADTETHRRLARLACRLEEYRLTHGQYPDKLDELPALPAHLDQQVVNAQPFRYSRKGDGYLLYSVGWNQKDGGGAMGSKGREGDWVWPSP